MSIQAADVIKLKCIYAGAISQKIDTECYSILCKEDIIKTVIALGKLLITLYTTSPTVCRGLECQILDYIETYSSYCIYCDEPCDRDYSCVNCE